MKKTLTNIHESIGELARRGNISPSRAFAAWYAINFFYVDEDDALESAAIDGGNDQGIDIVFPDDNNERIIVLQAYYPDKPTTKTPKRKWDALVGSLPFIRDTEELVKIGRADLAEQLKTLKDAHPDYECVVGLISLGLKSMEIERSLSAHHNAHQDISFFYDAQEDILEKYQTLIEAEQGIPEDTLSFIGDHFEDDGGYGRAYIGSVTASELQRLHQKYENKLFAGNIRLFLGSRKGGINAQMISTAKETPGTFWALNNGITIVADSVERDKDNSSAFILRRFSIVNGCQTTSCLAHADAASAAKVLMRVIAAKKGLKNEIVRYNNSQNTVKIWAVRAADPIQEQLRDKFKKIKIDYAPKQSGARKVRSEKIIELDKVTQYLASARKEFLLRAVNDKSELFDEPYQKLFRVGIQASEVYLAWLVGNLAETARQEHFSELSDDTNSPLLGVGSRFWIIYCAYKMLLRFSDLGSKNITLDKMATKDFKNALMKYVKQAVDIYYDAAVDTYGRDTFGSVKSALRSAQFLEKIDSKVNSRIVTRLKEKKLPDMASVAKSAK